MSYYIGSFNLRDFNFANKSSDNAQETLRRNFEKIAQIIIAEKFDVVALQEINAPLPLEHLTRILNSHETPKYEYDSRFGTNMPTQVGSKYPERYGFIVTTTSYTGKNRGYRTVQDQETTLKLPNCQISIDDCYANNYDHFTYEVDLDKKLILVPQRIETLGKYYTHLNDPADKLTAYRAEVSDHVPIKMTVDFN